MPPTLEEATLTRHLEFEARTIRLPTNPFSGEDQPLRWAANWNDTARRVIESLIAYEPDPGRGYLRLDPMALESETTSDFQLLRGAITKAAEEARFK